MEGCLVFFLFCFKGHSSADLIKKALGDVLEKIKKLPDLQQNDKNWQNNCTESWLYFRGC